MVHERSKTSQLQLIQRCVKCTKGIRQNIASKNWLAKGHNISYNTLQVNGYNMLAIKQALSLVVLLEAQNGKLAAYRQKCNKTSNKQKIVAIAGYSTMLSMSIWNNL